MQFDRQTRNRPAGLSRKDQLRLLGLIAVFGLVLLAIDIASRPQTWRWVFVGQENQDEVTAAAVDGTATESPPGEAPEIPPRQRSTGLFDEAAFDEVRDNTVGFQRSEARAFRHVIEALREIQNRSLAVAAREDVTYGVLAVDSEKFRGDVVRLEGDLRRLTPAVLPEDFADVSLFEAWILTPDSGDRPIRVLTLAADESLPRGEEVGPTPVKTDAVYFKRYAYASNGGGQVAPMFLAKKLAAVPAPPVARDDRLSPLLTGLITVPLVFLGFAFLRTVSRQNRRRMEFRMASASTGGPGDVAAESPTDFLSTLQLESPEGPDLEPSIGPPADAHRDV